MDKIRISGIYVVLNTVNGKRYIGSTVNMAGRKRQHFSGLKHKTHGNPNLQSDYDQYGKDAFVFSILEVCPEDQLIAREQWYLDTIHPEYNVNKTAGKVPFDHLITKKREESKRASFLAGKYKKRDLSTYLRGPSNPSYGKPKSPATREKIRKSVSGERNGNYGKPRDPETRRKISESNSKTYLGLVDPNGKVYKNIRFLMKFCEEHDLGLSSVVAVINGKRKHHKGWTRYDPSVIV